MCSVKSLLDFERLIEEHEQIIASIIKLKPVKELLFPDYLGAIKSSFYDLDETKAADQLNRTIEDLVNKNIPQYLWSYERFRNRSGVEENIYKIK